MNRKYLKSILIFIFLINLIESSYANKNYLSYENCEISYICKYNSELDKIKIYQKFDPDNLRQEEFLFDFFLCEIPFSQCGYIKLENTTLDDLDETYDKGVHLGAEIDLSNFNIGNLFLMGVDHQTISKVRPFLGLRGKEAHEILTTNKLILDPNEAVNLSLQFINKTYQHIENVYTYDSNKCFLCIHDFNNLDIKIRTAIIFYYYLKGNKVDTLTHPWDYITNNDWENFSDFIRLEIEDENDLRNMIIILLESFIINDKSKMQENKDILILVDEKLKDDVEKYFSEGRKEYNITFDYYRDIHNLYFKLNNIEKNSKSFEDSIRNKIKTVIVFGEVDSDGLNRDFRNKLRQKGIKLRTIHQNYEYLLYNFKNHLTNFLYRHHILIPNNSTTVLTGLDSTIYIEIPKNCKNQKIKIRLEDVNNTFGNKINVYASNNYPYPHEKNHLLMNPSFNGKELTYILNNNYNDTLYLALHNSEKNKIKIMLEETNSYHYDYYDDDWTDWALAMFIILIVGPAVVIVLSMILCCQACLNLFKPRHSHYQQHIVPPLLVGEGNPRNFNA